MIGCAMPHSGKQKVYIARCGRMYKIGRAVNPASRIKDLSTGSAYPIFLWKVFLVEDAAAVERWLHKVAQAYRGNGGREWFELPTWLTGWLAKQSAHELDVKAATKAHAPDPPLVTANAYIPKSPLPTTQAQEELIQCCHCGRKTRYRGVAFCYNCQSLAADLDARLSRDRT